MAPVYGFPLQLSVAGTRLDFMDAKLKAKQEPPWTGGLRGTREKDKSRVRGGLIKIEGPLSFQPNVAELQVLLPWILGGTPSGSSYPLADALTSEAVVIDRGANVYTYANTFASKGRFSCRQGEPLKVEVDCVACAESSGSSGSFSPASLNTATGPYMFFDAVISIASSNYQSRDFDLSIDNHFDGERFFNSQTLSTAANAKDRDIIITFHTPFGDSNALYTTDASTKSVVLTLTNGGHVLTFTMANVVFDQETADVEGHEEVMLPLVGKCYSNGGTASLATTLS